MSLTAEGAISGHDVPSEKALSTSDKSFDDKGDVETATVDANSEEGVLSDERDIATHVISVDDDPSLNPWTFRSFFIGLGLSAFGGVLAEIYYFKPQTVLVSLMFLAVVSYVLGVFMETFIPRRGFLRYLNPGPFNKKENAFIVIMASASANSALGTEVLAVQRLYYNITPNPAASIFLLFSSQLLGYGIGGMMRGILLYPSKMLYPTVLPLLSMFDALYEGGMEARKKLRVFYMVFAAIFIWELFPEWIFPLLTGFSIICLAAPNNAAVSRVFGGSNGNEGLGLLSICFDWQYISGGVNPMTIPLKAQFSNLLGYILCMVVFVAVYYKNIWMAQNFPFLSQLLFYENGTQYDQTLILNANYEVDPTLLAEQGLPYYSSTWIVYLLTSNLGLAATFTHLLLWNRDDLRSAWSWMTPAGVKQIWANFDWKFWKADGMRKQDVDDENIDPHYKQMLKYPDAPNSWYFVVFLLSFVVSLVVIYKSNSTLPWWGLIISLLLATISILFFGALGAITGFGLIIQPFIQMIGGYLHSGKPVANMYFVLYGYNTVSQAQLLLRDLKIAQYAKLPPRAAFTAQILGTLLGAILNFFIMNSIIDNQREILLSVQGTNIWSGQQPQQYNSQAIAWGGLSHELFSAGQRYQWVPWAYLVGLFIPVPFWVIHRYWPKLRADYLYTPVIAYFIGWLCVGINSSILSYFAIAFFSQWWLRTRHPRWFAKYNYIIGAALDGGTQVMVFILSFAVQGAGGTAHLFPAWWGANQSGNYDHCAYLN
ncbi:OPT oligopeptide transporter protein-domain-containing protein [Suillus fuscotomentosus]|uniref:OPT oligopeptide transporter protein-domain-containing protein n=1 Tax=Suillus fuscotomentosus TaxID=1912939 RepID=A0AAD4HGP3_9AGAM|nr:OPT oligopeptide transporter protein-domain-containing protein [Suillus fuscotomentosus]KAG1895556.1 OPT oligopeptide transporter protein-domain-containing protein [Suillus fuscotomentosus]